MLRTIDAVMTILVFFVSFPIWVLVIKSDSKDNRVDFTHIFEGFFVSVLTGLFWFVILGVGLVILLFQGIAEIFNFIGNYQNKKKKYNQKIKSGNNSVNIQVGGTIYGTGDNR